MNNIKKCSICKVDKELIAFSKDAQKKDGYCSKCKEGYAIYWKKHKEKNKEVIVKRVAAYFQNNKENRNEYKRKYYQENKEIVKATVKRCYLKRQVSHNQQAKEYAIKNKDKITEYKKEYAIKNKFKITYHSSNRRALKKDRIVQWSDKNKISEIYKEAKFMSERDRVIYHVDHVNPINHRLICGLHHELNLQIITSEENLSKNNKFKPYGVNENGRYEIEF